MKNLREILDSGIASVALLPEKNDYLLNENGRRFRKELIKIDNSKKFHSLAVTERRNYLNLNLLDKLDAYTVPLISHDYGAKTPLMWNTLYEHLNLNLRNIMLVANPEDAKIIFNALKNDPKYIGSGAGVGFKEISIQYLDEVIPRDLKAVNIIVKDNGKLIGYNTDAMGFVKSLEEKFRSIEKGIEGSNIIIFGAGGVAKEVAKLIAEKKPNKIIILNRTYSKAVDIAHELNQKYGQIAVAGGEDIIRGYMLNTFVKPDAAINLTDKGSDGPLENYSAFSIADEGKNGVGFNQTTSRTIARELKNLHPEIIIADIVLPRSGRSITLRIAENAGLENLLDGRAMVVYQAVPAYKLIEKSNPDVHKNKIDEEKILKMFKEVTNMG